MKQAKKFPVLSHEELARMFNVPVENIKLQYAANAMELDEMAQKAKRTGKKVNNYTEAQLTRAANQYVALSK